LNSSGFFLLFFGIKKSNSKNNSINEITGYFISKPKSLGRYVWTTIIIESDDRD